MCSTTSQHRLRAEVAARGKALDAAVQTSERKKPGRQNSVIPALLLFVALPGTGPWSQGSAVGDILGFEQLFLHSCSDFNCPSFPSAIVQQLSVTNPCPGDCSAHKAWNVPQKLKKTWPESSHPTSQSALFWSFWQNRHCPDYSYTWWTLYVIKVW